VGEKSIFKRIIDGEIPADKVYEDERILAFRDINPQAPTHVLVIPKEEIVSVDDLTESHQRLMGELWTAIPRIAQQVGLRNGYRVVVNCGTDGGQDVPHLHFHLLGGRRLTWPPG
jgi:histidine triad (HIT) family protein